MDVDERAENHGRFNVGSREDLRDELGELGVAVDVWGAGGGDAIERKVHCFHSTLNDIV